MQFEACQRLQNSKCTNHQLIIPGQEIHSRGIFSGREITFPVKANMCGLGDDSKILNF